MYRPRTEKMQRQITRMSTPEKVDLSESSSDPCVRLVVRIKPPSDEHAVSCVAPSKRDGSVIHEGQLISGEVRAEAVLLNDPRHRGVQKVYAFDHVYTSLSTNKKIYTEQIKSDIVRLFSEGRPVTVFAHGASGTGKTHTIHGNDGTEGILSMAVKDVLRLSMDFQDKGLSMTFSFFEIYNGKIRDLLQKHRSKEILPMREDATGKQQIPGLTEAPLSDMPSFEKKYQGALKRRTTGSTNVNVESSRGHSCLQVNLYNENSSMTEQDVPLSARSVGRAAVMKSSLGQEHSKRLHGRLSFLDLSGVENNKRTENVGTRLEESTWINSSLFVLGKVIAALKRGDTRIPYRDSKMTRLFKDSLNLSSQSIMLVALSPEVSEFYQTYQSLNTAVDSSNMTNLINEDTRLDVHRSDCQMSNRSLQNPNGITRSIGSPTYKPITPRPLDEIRPSRRTFSPVRHTHQLSGEMDFHDRKHFGPVLREGCNPNFVLAKTFRRGSNTRDGLTSREREESAPPASRSVTEAQVDLGGEPRKADGPAGISLLRKALRLQDNTSGLPKREHCGSGERRLYIERVRKRTSVSMSNSLTQATQSRLVADQTETRSQPSHVQQQGNALNNNIGDSSQASSQISNEDVALSDILSATSVDSFSDQKDLLTEVTHDKRVVSQDPNGDREEQRPALSRPLSKTMITVNTAAEANECELHHDGSEANVMPASQRKHEEEIAASLIENKDFTNALLGRLETTLIKRLQKSLTDLVVPAVEKRIIGLRQAACSRQYQPVVNIVPSPHMYSTPVHSPGDSVTESPLFATARTHAQSCRAPLEHSGDDTLWASASSPSSKAPRGYLSPGDPISLASSELFPSAADQDDHNRRMLSTPSPLLPACGRRYWTPLVSPSRSADHTEHISPVHIKTDLSSPNSAILNLDRKSASRLEEESTNPSVEYIHQAPMDQSLQHGRTKSFEFAPDAISLRLSRNENSFAGGESSPSLVQSVMESTSTSPLVGSSPRKESNVVIPPTERHHLEKEILRLINESSRLQLMKLRRITANRAAMVINYREKMGWFHSVDDLKNVKMPKFNLKKFVDENVFQLYQLLTEAE